MKYSSWSFIFSGFIFAILISFFSGFFSYGTDKVILKNEVVFASKASPEERFLAEIRVGEKWRNNLKQSKTIRYFIYDTLENKTLVFEWTNVDVLENGSEYEFEWLDEFKLHFYKNGKSIFHLNLEKRNSLSSIIKGSE